MRIEKVVGDQPAWSLTDQLRFALVVPTASGFLVEAHVEVPNSLLGTSVAAVRLAGLEPATYGLKVRCSTD